MATEKRYTAHFVEWDEYSEEYLYHRALTNDGSRNYLLDITGWDTFEEFVQWFDSHPEEDRIEFQNFVVTDNYSGNEMPVYSGTYEARFMRTDAERYTRPIL